MFLSNSFGLCEDFKHLPRLQFSDTLSPVGIALRTLLFGRVFAKFEDLGVVHVGDQILRFFAELVDLLGLA